MLRTASMTSVFAAPGDPSTVANGVVRNLSLAEGTNDTTVPALVPQRPTGPKAPGPDDPPIGISIDSARGAPDSNQLTVSFVGAPASADQPCGADYTAETVESKLAVVVIVVEHANPTPGPCRQPGAKRTAVATLATMLGNRAVLEVREGLPVPLVPPQGGR